MDYVLVHGLTQTPAGLGLLVDALERRGHRARTVDMPVDQPDLLAEDYARLAVEQLDGEVADPVLVGHSGGGLLLPAMARALDASRVVWLATLVPDLRGGTSLREQMEAGNEKMFGAEWLTWTEPLTEFPAISAYFLFHDCDVDTLRWAMPTLRQFQPTAVFGQPAQVGDLGVPSTYILPREDRTIRPEWMAEAARNQLDTEAVEVDGGHCPHVSRPELVADIITG